MLRKESFRLFIMAILISSGIAACPAGAGEIPDYKFHTVPNTAYYGGIHSIAKDRIGRMWFSGHDAVYLYDGNAFAKMDGLITCYAPSDSWNYGEVKTAGRECRLFTGSNHGMFVFDYDRMSFDCLFPGNIGPFDITGSGEVWFVRNGHLEMFDADDCEAGSICFSTESGLPDGEAVSSVFCTNDDVYVSLENVLMKYDRESCMFVPFAAVGKNSTEIKDVLGYGDSLYVLTLMDGLFVCHPDGTVDMSPASMLILRTLSSTKVLHLDESGIIWIATQAGLLLLEPETGATKLFRMELGNPYSLPNNSVWTIFPDPDGGLWIGTYGGRLAYSTLQDRGISFLHAGPEELSGPIVSCFGEDRHGSLWIGTEGGGISVIDSSTGKFRYFSQNDGSGLASDFIKRIWKDRDGIVYVASFNGGVQIYDEAGRRFRTVAGSSSRYPLSVYDFLKEGDDGLWLSSPDENLKYKKNGSEKVEYVGLTDDSGLLGRRTVAEMMFHDGDGNLCLLTPSGLAVIDVRTRTVLGKHCIADSPFNVNNLISFCYTSSGDIWLGTRGGGVNVLYADGRYMNFSDVSGCSLDGRTVFGIVQDDESGDMWLSTDNGIYRYVKSTGLFAKSIIDSNDNCGSYYIRSYFKTSKGEILFGGTDGFIRFTPSRIRLNSQKPEAFFTGLLVNNTVALTSDKNSPLDRQISSFTADGRDETIRLSHRQANFGVQLSCDSYLHADKNRYSYRMAGMSDEWIVLPQGQRVVSFFNMRPGKYVFEAKAANNDGIWGDKVSSLCFEVLPSPFLSVWAYIVYAAFSVFLILACWHFLTKKKLLEQKLELEQIKEKNMRELTKARVNFFTSISHDLKTPLTLIVDPLKQLKEHLPDTSPAMTYVHLIERNAARIQRMISQLLQFREIESQKISLNRQPGDLVRFVRNIFSLFENIASSKDIETDFRTSFESFYTKFDYDVMEKIITNLVSNAFKYAPQETFVGIVISKADAVPENMGDEWISISVINTGSDIPEDKKDIIFRSFSRLPSLENTIESSTGLGLAIVKELIDNLGGKIHLKSGSSTVSFEVLLPFSSGAGLKEDNDGRYEYAVSEADNLLIETSEMKLDAGGLRKHSSVVIIDDDVNLRNYMEMRLSRKYNVYTATNGDDGISKALKVNPQLVISDLVMPGTDGFDVCRRIRSDIRTSHIPVIILSAAGNYDDNRRKAMDCGASVFIDKPVDMDFLMKQADNLIVSMRQLKEMYSKKYIAEPSKLTISSMDEELLKKAMDNIEKNMDNSDYDVDAFVSDMAFGRTALYRKINDVTGMSIKEFIMDVRLKRAAQLLKESEYTVAEISVMTGFVNPKYFSICFRRHFELSPSEFRKSQVS